MKNFFTSPIAHRGLHGGNIPENSMAAFYKAIEQGYAIETDVRPTKDGALVLFHDDSLFRMTGREANVCDLTLEELSKLSLAGTDEKIPLLSDFLNKIEGRVPILLEVKNISGNSSEFLKNIAAAFQGYRGAFAMQSFNPLYVRKFKKLCPAVPCGILTAYHLTTKDFASPFKKLKKSIVSGMKFNFFVKPDFISFEFHDPTRKMKNFKGQKLCWTVRCPEEEALCKTFCDEIIFEGFLPEK